MLYFLIYLVDIEEILIFLLYILIYLIDIQEILIFKNVVFSYVKNWRKVQIVFLNCLIIVILFPAGKTGC